MRRINGALGLVVIFAVWSFILGIALGSGSCCGWELSADGEFYLALGILAWLLASIVVRVNQIRVERMIGDTSFVWLSLVLGPLIISTSYLRGLRLPGALGYAMAAYIALILYGDFCEIFWAEGRGGQIEK